MPPEAARLGGFFVLLVMSSTVSDRWLFWGPTLIWASTWHVILYQLASGVPVLNSVGWRFGLADLRKASD